MNCNGVCKECKGRTTKERLFRGRQYDTGEWVYGCYVWEVFRNYGDGEIRLISLSTGKGAAHVDPKTLCEFTGAFDKNGTRIFEDDVIDIPGWVVTYSTGMKCYSGTQAGWYIQRDNWESWSELMDKNEVIVIGNVHDNPELLKEAKDDG